MIDIDIKRATNDTIPFVYSTWLYCFRYYSYFCKRIKNSIFFKNHHKLLDNIISQSSTQILIAHSSEEPEVILGYIVYELMPHETIHFIYVKNSFRKFGIAKSLLKESKLQLKETSFSHWCFDTDWIMAKYPDQLTYNPYIIFGSK